MYNPFDFAQGCPELVEGQVILECALKRKGENKNCYNSFVIITKSEPYTKEEIEKLQELFDGYIKTVIDIEKKIREIV